MTVVVNTSLLSFVRTIFYFIYLFRQFLLSGVVILHVAVLKASVQKATVKLRRLLTVDLCCVHCPGLRASLIMSQTENGGK